jgi:two-component system response regulator YesN
MWNLMVVEDEAIVRMGLRSMIPWEQYDIYWAVEASNGLEALKLFEERDVDIVITDIRMPRMSGLELTRKLRENHPEIAVVLLTSFDDFAYMKEAIKLGVIDYIHKPTMSKDEIADALNKAISHLTKTRKDKSASDNTVKVLTGRERSHFLLSMLDKYTFPVDWEVTWKLFSLPIFETGYSLVIFRLILSETPRDEDIQMKDSLFYSVKHFIEEYISHDWNGAICTRGTREIIWLCPQHENVEESMRDYIHRMLGKLENRLHTNVSYTFSQTKYSMDKLPNAYMESLLQFPLRDEARSTFIRLAKQYIDANFFSEISLMKVAEELHVSHSYLSRQFMKETGENFVDFVTRKRMIHAKKLLRETTMKVYEISTEVGYKNQHYFTRLFKENVGITPLEYRKHG